MKPKIIAENIEVFKEIEAKLATLHQSVLDQIETAEKGLLGIDCKIRETYSKELKVCLPKTTQIKDYSGEFFFRIGGNYKDKQIEYVFVDNF